MVRNFGLTMVFRYALAMTDEEFGKLVDEAIDAIPEHIRARMQNVAITFADAPTDDELREQGMKPGHVLFGLYQGIPLPDRGAEYMALPDKITIYKKPILAAYTDPADIKECVENTVWHEVAHHFGYDDPWIRKEEERRGKQR